MSLVLRLPHETHLFRSCSNLPHMCPNVVWFWHFDFEMCSATMRALFEQLNCQKCSGSALLCAFRLRNVLRAKVVCAFSTTQLPKVLRQWGDFNILASTCASCQSRVLFCNKLWAWGVFNILTSKCASRHSGGLAHFDLLSSCSLSFPTTVAASLHMSEVWLLNFLRKYVLRWGRDRSEQTLGRLLGSSTGLVDVVHLHRPGSCNGLGANSEKFGFGTSWGVIWLQLDVGFLYSIFLEMVLTKIDQVSVTSIGDS